jgi:hypothetical protein
MAAWCPSDGDCQSANDHDILRFYGRLKTHCCDDATVTENGRHNEQQQPNPESIAPIRQPHPTKPSRNVFKSSGFSAFPLSAFRFSLEL